MQFTTDVIVGFPGETEEDFRETLDFVREAEFLMVHIFPYSKRKGTPAAEMAGQVPEEIKRRRLHELEAVVALCRKRLLETALGREAEVLFESHEGGYAYGHTADFLEVAIPSTRPMHGEWGRVILKETDGSVCYGQPV